MLLAHTPAYSGSPVQSVEVSQAGLGPRDVLGFAVGFRVEESAYARNHMQGSQFCVQLQCLQASLLF